MVFIQDIIYIKKDGEDVVNFDEYESAENLWMELHVHKDKVKYFISFGF